MSRSASSRRRFLFVLCVFVATMCSSGSGAAEVQGLPSAQAQRLLGLSSRVLFDRPPSDLRLDRLRAKAAPSRLRVIVVGCDFSDSLMYGRDRTEFPGWPAPRRDGQIIPGTSTPMFAAHDSTYFDLQMRRVDEYFRSVSFGKFHLEWDVHPTIVNLPRPMGYYGDPDSSDVRSVAMAQQVIDAVDGAVDFSNYDTFVLIHAGAGSETDILGDSPEQIPSNYLDRRDFVDAEAAGVLPQDRLLSADGPVEHVLVLPEAESQDPFPAAGLSGFFDVLGVYCFEFGLRLGMLSLTDFTPAGSPDSQGIGNFGLMGFGLFTGLSIVPAAPSAINRHLMGWADVVEVTDDADVRLSPMGPMSDVSDTLLVRVPINDREYWLLEYRLQDPNGDLFYSFADSNRNRVPDYYDADSDFGNGWPTSSYDPSTDVWESTLDSEWDYFMSENPARSADRCMRGGGSGVYIYHVDERVIENSILSGVNTINADPGHKGVDVEEADGIQDLDSARPSGYILGWDGDSWRAETAQEFGPDTVPSTTTAAGLATGIRFSGFSAVVVDSLPRVDGNCTGFVYRPAMSFRVEFPSPSGPTLIARRDFDGISPNSSLRVVDLGSSATDPMADGRLELVCLADSGRVLAFDSSLAEWTDGDADASTDGVLAGTSCSRWWGAPVVVDFDGDGALDVLASSDAGVIALRHDGQELLDGDATPATIGVLWSDTAFAPVSPLVLLEDGVPTALTVVSDGTELRGLRLRWIGAGVDVRLTDAVSGQAIGPAALLAEADPRLVIAVASGDTNAFAFFPSADGEGVVVAPVDSRSSAAAVTTWAGAPGGGAFLWSDVEGGWHRTDNPPRNLPSTGAVLEVATIDHLGGRSVGAPSPVVGADLAGPGSVPVFAVSSGGTLVALDAGLHPRRGFPFHPERDSEAVTGSVVAAPSLVDLNSDGQLDFLWQDGEGTLYAVDSEGRLLEGFPLLGPAEPLDSPLVADLDGDGAQELLLMGRFAQLTDVDAPRRSFGARARGSLRVHALGLPVSAYAPVVGGASGRFNRGRQPAGSLAAVAGPAGLDEDSVSLQPNPVVAGELRVRVVVGQAATVRAVLYNLEGEEVASTPAVFTDARSAFDESIDVSGLGSGMYVCRIVSGGDSILRPFAVAR